MIKVVANSQNSVAELIADLKTDVEDLATYNVGAGSTCLVIEDSSVWMLGNDNVWHEI